MAYFSNGSAAQDYETKYCFHCVHMDKTGACPVWDIHLLHSYTATGDVKNILEDLIPTSKGGLFADQCKMFITSDTIKRKRHDKRQLDLYNGN